MNCLANFGKALQAPYIQPLTLFATASTLLNILLVGIYWRNRARRAQEGTLAPTGHRSSSAQQRMFWPLIAGLITAGIGLVATEREFLVSLGHAALIAGVLAGTVDLYLKQRLLKEILLDASKFLIGYELPTEIKDRIRELISAPLIRRDFELRCQISPADASGRCTSVLEWTFEIENLSHKPQEYQQSAVSLENSAEDQPKFLGFRCDSTEAEASYVVEPGNAELDVFDQKGRRVINGKKIEIPPHNRAAGRRYILSAKFESKRKDSDFFCFFTVQVPA